MLKRPVLARTIGAAAAIAVLAGCSGQDRGPQNADWPAYGLNSEEQRFSPLAQISADNVSDLGLAWSLPLPDSTHMEGTPLQVGGVIYLTANLSMTYAVDARTGKELWRYDPEPGKYNARALRTTPGSASRGLAYWKGHVIIASTDGRLISLDAKTGKPVWIVDTIKEEDSRKQITGAPRVFKDMVIIGNSGADYGTRGYVTAYDVATGKQRWRFYTVPPKPGEPFENEAMEMAAKTWSGEWWKWAGGGTVWNAITYDPELNRVYIGVGNSSNYNPRFRSGPDGGDNLFIASIVALDANTGKYAWHYQVNPNEAWDWKATADIVLATVEIDGKPRRVLMHAPTNGFFYVIDRDTGKLVSANKFEKATWADRIDLKTGRPVEKPNIRYENGVTKVWPSAFGAHNWQAMSFNPQTGLVYIPTLRLGGTYQTSEEMRRDAEKMTVGARRYWFGPGMQLGVFTEGPDDGKGALVAYDPKAAKIRWRVQQDSAWNGGTMTTASNLVFQGTNSGWLRAYDGQSGKELWKFNAHNALLAPPITYAIDGVQYIAILAGGGNPNAGPLFDEGWRFRKHVPHLLVFKIGGKATLPTMPAPFPAVQPYFDASQPVDAALAAKGAKIWAGHCLICHGVAAKQTSPIAPDLRESSAAQSLDALKSVLREGVLATRGMPQFDELTDDEIAALQAYIREQAGLATKAPDAQGKQRVKAGELKGVGG